MSQPSGVRTPSQDILEAQLFTRPPQPPPIVVAGSTDKSATLAGRIGDGFFGVTPSNQHRDAFKAREAPGSHAWPRSTCAGPTASIKPETPPPAGGPTAPSRAQPHRAAHPKAFAQVLSLARTNDIIEAVALGPDPNRHLDLIATFAKAGFNQILVHQIGPDQEGRPPVYETEVMTALQGSVVR